MTDAELTILLFENGPVYQENHLGNKGEAHQAYREFGRRQVIKFCCQKIQ
jgi:hypothetical protein